MQRPDHDALGASDSGQTQRFLVELQQKLESLPTIEQAKGILMARFALDADRAFDLLVRWSQRNNVKLRTISDALVSSAAEADALDQVIRALQGSSGSATLDLSRSE